MLFISSTAFDYDVLADQRDRVDLFGMQGIEFSGGSEHRSDERIVARLGQLVGAGLAGVLVHNYFPTPADSFVLNFASRNPDIAARSLALAGRAMDLCRTFGVPYYSFHPGYLYDGLEMADGHFDFHWDSYLPYAEALAQFLSNFAVLRRMSAERGVLLAVENLFPRPDNVRTSLCVTLEETVQMLEAVPEEVGLLLDLGHLNIAARWHGFDRIGYVQAVLDRFGDRVFEVHLSANSGEADEHLPLQEGDWQLGVIPLFAGLPGADGGGVNITLESRRLDPPVLAETCRLIRDALDGGA